MPAQPWVTARLVASLCQKTLPLSPSTSVIYPLQVSVTVALVAAFHSVVVWLSCSQVAASCTYSIYELILFQGHDFYKCIQSIPGIVSRQCVHPQKRVADIPLSIAAAMRNAGMMCSLETEASFCGSSWCQLSDQSQRTTMPTCDWFLWTSPVGLTA